MTDCFSDLKYGIRVFHDIAFSSFLRNSTTNAEVSIKIQTMGLVLNVFSIDYRRDSLCLIYFNVITLQWLKKRFKPVELFFQSREWSENMWSCATTDIAHAQRSYLTVARLTIAEWRSALMNNFRKQRTGVTNKHTRSG